MADASPEDASVAETKAVKSREARRRIQQDLLPIIVQHDKFDRKPPFSTTELIVIAALSINKEVVTVQEVLSWILRNFKSFGIVALSDYATHTISGDHLVRGLQDCVVPDFENAITSWELPIKFSTRPDEGMWELNVDLEMTISLEAGRIFLHKWLAPATVGHFRFLDLPAELRNKIYELVFTLPDSGMFVHGVRYARRYGLHVDVLEREVDNFAARGIQPHWPQSALTYRMKSSTLRTLLALLSVNKQIYREAMPFFYQVNHFWFDRMETAITFARCITPQRFQHMGDMDLSVRLSTRLDFCNLLVSEWVQFMELLAETKLVRKLTVHFPCEDMLWQNLPLAYRKAVGMHYKFKHPSQVPGMRQLAIAGGKAMDFQVEGEGSAILVGWLLSAAQKLKAGEVLEEPIDAPKKKRKNVAGEETAGVLVAKRAKRNK